MKGCADAVSVVKIAPYKPTPPHILRLLGALLPTLLEHVEGQPVFYEAGCGLAHASKVAVLQGFYSICVDIDTNIIVQAKRLRHRYNVLIDYVVSDVRSFCLRRNDVVYYYLYEGVMGVVGSALCAGGVVISLDYPVPQFDTLNVYEVGGHVLYVQVAKPARDEH